MDGGEDSHDGVPAVVAGRVPMSPSSSSSLAASSKRNLTLPAPRARSHVPPPPTTPATPATLKVANLPAPRTPTPPTMIFNARRALEDNISSVLREHRESHDPVLQLSASMRAGITASSSLGGSASSPVLRQIHLLQSLEQPSGGGSAPSVSAGTASTGGAHGHISTSFPALPAVGGRHHHQGSMGRSGRLASTAPMPKFRHGQAMPSSQSASALAPSSAPLSMSMSTGGPSQRRHGNRRHNGAGRGSRNARAGMDGPRGGDHHGTATSPLRKKGRPKPSTYMASSPTSSTRQRPPRNLSPLPFVAKFGSTRHERQAQVLKNSRRQRDSVRKKPKKSRNRRHARPQQPQEQDQEKEQEQEKHKGKGKGKGKSKSKGAGNQGKQAQASKTKRLAHTQRHAKPIGGKHEHGEAAGSLLYGRKVQNMKQMMAVYTNGLDSPPRRHKRKSKSAKHKRRRSRPYAHAHAHAHAHTGGGGSVEADAVPQELLQPVRRARHSTGSRGEEVGGNAAHIHMPDVQPGPDADVHNDGSYDSASDARPEFDDDAHTHDHTHIGDRDNGAGAGGMDNDGMAPHAAVSHADETAPTADDAPRDSSVDNEASDDGYSDDEFDE